MQSSKLTEWLNLGASVGVLVGLFLVAYEVRQAGQYSFAQIRGDMLSHYSNLSMSSYSSDIMSVTIKAIEQPEQLTDEELAKAYEWLSAFMNVVHKNAVYYYDFGWAGDPTDSFHTIGKFNFNSAFARAWFDSNKEWLHPRLAEIIKGEIEANPVNNRFLMGAALREKIIEINSAAN
jgi:hypothetical protein